MSKMTKRIWAVLTAALLMVALSTPLVFANNIDEIENYVITVDLRDDASADITYHVEWRVLDSEIEGPLEWVMIGLPNIHTDEIEELSDNIDYIYMDYDGGAFACIEFDRPYEEGELVSFDFAVHCDYLYQMNLYEEGSTVYTLTPGWFDEIVVDRIVVRWNADKVSGWSPSCLVKDGYCTFESSLDEGDSFTVHITYPNDAFPFVKNISDDYEETYYDDDWDARYDDSGSSIMWFFPVVFLFIFWGNLLSGTSSYKRGRGLGTSREKKITRTRVEYYSNCPNCGAPRSEGAKKDCCEYCGTNLVKSEVILKEEDLTEEEKAELKKYNTDGEYTYTNPDTFIRVHTVYVPSHVSSGTHGGGHHHGGGGRGGSGGCACACACASCACACACACAGGGRAGCSNKDFYKGIDLDKLD